MYGTYCVVEVVIGCVAFRLQFFALKHERMLVDATRATESVAGRMREFGIENGSK